jgi:hypothetical protein
MAKSSKAIDKNAEGKNKSTDKKFHGKFARITSPPPKPNKDKKKDR